MEKKNSYFSREWVIYGILVVIVLALFGKLLYLQLFGATEVLAKGAFLKNNSRPVISERGTIADAQGNVLAKSLPSKDVFADPKTMTSLIIKDNKGFTAGQIAAKKEEYAGQLASILGRDSGEISRLISKDLSWVSLAKQIDLDKVQRIEALKIPGIGFSDTYKRVYPAGSMAASMLGIVNLAGDGVEGIELYYNSELKGEKKPVENNVQIGSNLELTLDSSIQHLAEFELDKIMEESQPQKAVILAMDPMTGKILGMASRPSFDPNNYQVSKSEDRKNLALSMIYEPGSTFKIITGSAALEENVVTPDKTFNDPGYLIVGSRRITNWDSDRKANGVISFTDGMKLSSNVVLAQVGELMGKDLFYTYLKSFGFGSKTKIDIAGEEQGLLIDKKMVKDLELATMSFGQANLVTPIQLLTAIGAVANGGNLMQPYIVDKVTNKDGTLITQIEPKIVRKVISASTSKSMVDILEKVVDSGTGSRAKIPGIKVAGKTGTAQKIDPKTGLYSDTDKIVSFVAFAPADKPKIAVLVVLDTPKGPVIQGGTLAGPHAKKIIEGALQYYGIPVAANTPSDLQNIDDQPIPESSAPKPADAGKQPGKGEVAVPNLRGLTMRQAGEILGKLDLRYKFSGSGFACQQFPKYGKIVNQGDTVEVEFSLDGSESKGNNGEEEKSGEE